MGTLSRESCPRLGHFAADNQRMHVFLETTKELIKTRKTTQEWVSGKAGVPYRTFRGYFSLDRLPDVEIGQNIAEALESTVADWMRRPSKADPWLQSHRQLIDDLKALTPDQLDTIATTAGVQAAKNRKAGERDHANATGSA